MPPRKLNLGAALTPEELAKAARLHYVVDQEFGYTRRRNGSGFVYANSRGAPLTDPRKIQRIERLAIPPAWRDVWICHLAKGHLQATGRDARKRKQYVYHPRWQEIANLAKFARLEQFGDLMPKLRRTVRRHLAGSNLSKTRVLAGMVALLDLTGIRIGNEEYVAENGSYGLTTLRNRHVVRSPQGVELRFRAKGGFRREVLVSNKRLVRLIEDCSQLKGSNLFQFVDDDGVIHPIASTDVNEYLQQIAAAPFTAKDFRTWKASAQAAGTLFEHRDVSTASKRKRIAKDMICEAAATLSNTPTVCRNYYIHPGLVTSYVDGHFPGYFERFGPQTRRPLSVHEQVLTRFLREWKPA